MCMYASTNVHFYDTIEIAEFSLSLGGQALGYTSFRELRVETLVTHVGIGSQGPLLSHAVSTKVFSSTM